MRFKTGQKRYRLPKDFDSAVYLRVKRGKYHYTSWFISFGDLVQRPKAPYGMPEVYSIHEGYLYVIPSPDKNYYVELIYKAVRKA